jgi:hypothetical protein
LTCGVEALFAGGGIVFYLIGDRLQITGAR